jgi:hypothetical protein
MISSGEKFKSHLNYSWLYDNTGMSFEWGFENSAGKYTPVLKGLTGWNAEDKSIVTRGVFRGGGLATTVLKPKDNEWTVKRETIRPDGSSRLIELLLTFVDDETLTIQAVQQDGEPVTYKRKKK